MDYCKTSGGKGGKKCSICNYKYKHPFAYAMWGQMCPNNSLGWSFLFEPNCALCNKQMKLKSEGCGWRSPSRQCLVSIRTWVIACFVFWFNTTTKYIPKCVNTVDIGNIWCCSTTCVRRGWEISNGHQQEFTERCEIIFNCIFARLLLPGMLLLLGEIELRVALWSDPADIARN